MAAYAPASSTEPVLAADPDESDESLAARAATDPAAMTELYRRYRPRIDHYCRQKLADPDQVQDVASQVFLKVLEGVSRGKIERFRPWIFAVAHNEIISVYRTRRPLAMIDAADLIPDHAISPEEHALEQNELQHLRMLMAHLAPAERQVMEMRLFGLTNPEISERLGRTYSWVGSTQHRAYKHLRALVDDVEREGNAP